MRGRTLSNFDVNDSRKVAVVNQTLVNRYFGSEDPIGRHVKLTMLESLPNGAVENPRFEIVGVIADVKNRGIEDAPMPEVIIPYTITGAFERSILVKTAAEPGSLLNDVRRGRDRIERHDVVIEGVGEQGFLVLANGVSDVGQVPTSIQPCLEAAAQLQSRSPGMSTATRRPIWFGS